MRGVIMIARNEATLLQSSLEAVEQSILDFGDLDFIFVDDGSTDATPEIAKRFRWLRYFRPHERLGVSGCRNYATTELQSGSDTVTFLDAHIWPIPGCIEILSQTAQENHGAIIAPAHCTLETHPMKAPNWEENLAVLRRDPRGVNLGSGLVFANQKFWFYLCVNRRKKGILTERTGCHAVGVTMTRTVLERMGGWTRTPGWWGGNDVAFSIKAWRLGVPVLSQSRALMIHAQKSFASHETSIRDQVLNRYYGARQLFSDALYAAFWKPGLDKQSGWLPSYAAALESPEARAEREEFRAKIVQPESEFLSTFVYPRLHKDYIPCSQS